MATRYGEAVWKLLQRCIATSAKPMTRQEIIGWFRHNYPDVKSSTVGVQTGAHCVNSESRKNHGTTHDILYRQPDKTFVAYNAEKHGRFNRYGLPEDEWDNRPEANEAGDIVEFETNTLMEDAQRTTTFDLERDLQAALRQDIEQLEVGLTIIDGGSERSVEGGRIDISASDREGNTVVIELKAGIARPNSITQIMGYMVSVADEDHNPVRGILVAAEFQSETIRAARAMSNLQLKKYSFKFSFADV